VAAITTSASAGADEPVVVLVGEADTTTAARLREMLATLLETGARLVTVDASGLSFLDSASPRVLVLAARALQGRHGTLVFARPQPLVVRLLEITGADSLLDVRELAGSQPLAPHTGQAPMPWPASTRWATAICWASVAWLADGAYWPPP
jgi:anti-sigma B factor antagonist